MIVALSPVCSRTNCMEKPCEKPRNNADSQISHAIRINIESGSNSRQGLRIFLFATSSRPALGSTQPPIQGVPGTLSLVVKRPEREPGQSPPSSADA